MTIDATIVRLLKKLRDRDRPKSVLHPGDALPVDVLQSLVHRMGLSSLRIDFLGVPEQPLVSKTIRSNVDSSLGPLEEHKLILLQRRSGARVSLGHAVIIANRSVAVAELQAIEHLLCEVAEEVQASLSSRSSHRCELAARRIEAFLTGVVPPGPKDESYISEEIPLLQRDRYYTLSELPAGTVIRRLLYLIHAAIRPRASVFVVLDEGLVWPEVYQTLGRRSPTFVNNPPVTRLSPSLWRACMHYDSFEWRPRDGGGLGEALSRFTGKPSHGTEYIVGVCRSFGQVAGGWVIQLDQGQVPPPEAKWLIERVAKNTGRQARHLYQRRTGRLIVNPYFASRDTRVDPKKVFVLMPFSEDWSQRVWLRLLRPTIEGLGFSAMRADDMFGRDIMEDIWRGILTSKVVVADITARNANVFYELGIAHTLGKPVILLTQCVEDIPFDLNRYRHIVYQDNIDGFDQLARKLIGAILEINGEDKSGSL